MILAGKKALVTGGSRGIGEGIALAMAAEGAAVAITGRRMETLAPVAKAIRDAGGAAEAFVWDVSRAGEAETQINRIADAMGGLDIAVNNAGVIGPSGFSGGFFEMTEEAWDYIEGINLKGMYFACQAEARRMIARGTRGKIINIASDAGLRPEIHPYGISKWGVVGFTRGLARELMPKGINVNAIAPGPVATLMMGVKPGESGDWLGSAFGRFARPSEVGELAVFLASEASARIAGDIIAINGDL
jgi:NAD(P)-dependent dehydrogenase (short-subunit alcohol dehydrogenase family)